MTHRKARREFLKQTTLAGVGYWVAGGAARAAEGRSANDRIRIACIGVGGKGSSDTDNAGEVGDIVALCDCDEDRLGKKAEKFPEAKKYFDFRKMFDELGKSIDAVTVSTPDHTHAVASMMALRSGKHVYCQKPLTHSVYEARLLRETAAKMKVATQMGNQGTANDGLRTAVEVVQSGAIGPVREVHVWTNRPIWPQAPDVMARPTETPPVPENLHWDEFLGPAPYRPYSPAYHPFKWRGWWDFGTGALGDMACHTCNMPYMALKLGAPSSVVAEAGDLNPETCPSWAKVTYNFPARGDLPACKLFWYEGREGGQSNKTGKRMLPPEDLLAKVLKPGEEVAKSASILVGDKGILYSSSDYGGSYRLTPESDFAGYKPPEPWLPRHSNEGKKDNDLNMKQEWAAAMRGGPPAMSNFDYSGPLTEMVLLGNVAIRVGKPIQWDAANLKALGCPEADQYINPPLRNGWTL
ncbi:MAG TPA: Gfo/Idh/MocA family oxidoreductase [Pirellulales bacterium]|nr:Gfo/Idh/MocA family oxidoreductase [Pirellulales bacterium]